MSYDSSVMCQCEREAGREAEYERRMKAQIDKMAGGDKVKMVEVSSRTKERVRKPRVRLKK